MKNLGNRDDLEEILRRLHAVHPASQRVWGRMSASQMICHLSDAFRMFMSERAVTPGRAWYPHLVLRSIALWTPLPWPKGFGAVPELDQQKGGTRPAEFEGDMQELRGLIERFARVPGEFEWPSHPHFGRMSHRAWMRLGYLHTDHHLRQFGA